MAYSYAMQVVVGHVGGDPEIKRIDSGSEIATFSLAVSRRVKNEDVTDWFRCTAWREADIDVLDKMVHKGDLLLIQGEPQSNKWVDRDDIERIMWNVNVQKITLLEKRQGGSDRAGSRDGRDARGGGGSRADDRGRDRGGRDERPRGRDDASRGGRDDASRGGRDDRRAGASARGDDRRGGTDYDRGGARGGGAIIDDEIPFAAAK